MDVLDPFSFNSHVVSQFESFLLLYLFVTAYGVCFFVSPKEQRNPSFFEQRLKWDECCEKHVRRNLQAALKDVQRVLRHSFVLHFP